MITKLLQYVWKSVARHRVRSALTALGIATAMFLFCFIEGLQNGVREATESEATKNLLIAYQKSRFCPATSNLPERYASQIARVPGVVSVMPTRIFVNNCRASLDSVTFRGVPPEILTSGVHPVQLSAGSLDKFAGRTDAAIVGQRLAARRNLKVGDRFTIGGFGVGVAGIFDSEVPGEDNLAYTQLSYLQQARGKDAIGRVTQFEVAISDPTKTDEIIAKIDDLFRSEEIQTTTKSHKAFISSATGDLLGLIRFTRYLGFLCVLLVLALTANTVYVMVQDRVKEHAVLQTLGFKGSSLFFIVVMESLILSLGGGIAGTLAAALALRLGHLGLGAEGVQITFLLTPAVVAGGLLASLVTGLMAGMMPAIQAARAPIVESLRRV
ncbi:MAG: ABC transporter permease [Candidatus Sumerlaeaceae bacterium]|nr:ABC transporter permease [Candidatus Sumerlaeaceae bacterium]